MPNTFARPRAAAAAAAAARLAACLAAPALLPAGPARAQPGPGAPIPRVEVDMQMVADAFAGLRPRPVNLLPPAQARLQPAIQREGVNQALLAMGRDTASAALVPGVTAADRTIPGAAGPIPARVFTPAGPGPFPVVVYFHGGGFVIADRLVYDRGARGLAAGANAVVVSVDYRRGPENRFPAAHDDALAAYRWAVTDAASVNGDPTRVALAGESAGGNLAVSTAVQARAAGLRAPAHVVAVYPIAQPDTTTPSATANANAVPLSRAALAYFAANYLRSPADGLDPRYNVAAADLRGLPPVTIVNADIDPLLDDGRLLAEALGRAGVSVERKVYDGVTHEFFGMYPVVRAAQNAQSYAGLRLRQAFAR